MNGFIIFLAISGGLLWAIVGAALVTAGLFWLGRVRRPGRPRGGAS